MNCLLFLGDIILIDLSLKYEGDIGISEPFVCIVSTEKWNTAGIKFIQSEIHHGLYRLGSSTIKLEKTHATLDLGEILIVFPKQNLINRFFRPNAIGNTILLTEQCDQLCVMCSQPPKRKDYLHWQLYLEAASLIPNGGVLGISGGEPTLYKEKLLDFLIECVKANRSLQINVLTNAQHFDETDLKKLTILNKNVLWGVPIYSPNSSEHDEIVSKEGAFDNLLRGFNFLLKSGSRVELRTVLLQKNYSSFTKLSKFVSRHFTWIEKWAIMQLEPMGYARIDWPLKFVDTTIFPERLEQAVLAADASGIHTELYNFPLCSVPKELQKFCVKSISDWKQKYLPDCDKCSLKNSCCGFFEWYDRQEGYSSIRAINA
jgi:His-Xaa-Ser system radical SAM maturase HxsC